MTKNYVGKRDYYRRNIKTIKGNIDPSEGVIWTNKFLVS